MKILKPGKVEMRKFVYPNCGCEFAASVNEMNEYTDFFTCPQEGCRFDAIDWVKNGEPYEEPAPTQTDRERLINLLREWRRSRSEEFAVSLAYYLIAHGVTFREE